MPDNKSISQLTTAEQTTSSDLFETAIPNGSLGYLSRKVSLDAIANFIAKALQYSDLQTEAKTLIDAINEAAQSGGGGGASIEEMTQAQYNALTPEQKADGTLRAISDATTSIGDIDDVNVSSPADGEVLAYDGTSSKWVNREIEADAVAYDNTSSGLTATDVQAAIDEVAEAINNPDVTAGTFTPNANINLLRSTLIKVNSIKFLSVIFNVREATDIIGTMSSGFEASHNYDFTIANDNGTSTRARINQNNILSFSTATPVQGSYYALTITYI